MSSVGEEDKKLFLQLGAVLGILFGCPVLSLLHLKIPLLVVNLLKVRQCFCRIFGSRLCGVTIHNLSEVNTA
jgi:hypothetical protein